MNSRSIIFSCLFAASIALSPPASAQDEPLKIGVINMQMLIAESAAGKDLQQQLEAFQSKRLAESQALRDKARDLQRVIGEGTGVLTEAKLSELRSQLDQTQLNLRQLQTDTQREGQKIQTEGLQRVEAEIQPVLTAFQAEFGYDLILSNQRGIVLIAGARADITQKVIDRLE